MVKRLEWAQQNRMDIVSMMSSGQMNVWYNCKITKEFAAVKLVMPPNLNQSEYIHVHAHLDCSVKINYEIIIVNILS